MTTPPTVRPLAIELRDIVKRFPGVVANDGVDLTVRAGHDPRHRRRERRRQVDADEDPLRRPPARRGHDHRRRRRAHFRSPRDAIDAGIGMVFQHFMLADNFTVWENIVLGDEPGHAVRARHRRGPPHDPRARRPVRPRRRPRRARRRPRRRRAASASRSSRCSTAAPGSSSSTSRPPCSCPQEVDELFAIAARARRRRVRRSSSSPTSSTRCWRSPTPSPSSAPVGRSPR